VKTSLLAALCSAVVFTGGPAHAQDAEPVKSAQVDLDGDGKADAVTLTPGGGGKFTLKVGGVTAQGGSADANEPLGFTVVDLDSGDKWKELVVHSLGDVDGDHRFFVYGYDGKAVRLLGDVNALSEAKGNGIVLVDQWQGFWNKRDKYALDRKAWKLVHVPQELYAVGVGATVKKSFPLQRSRTEAAVVATLAQGSKVEVLAAGAGPKGGPWWYLVKSSTGLLGWVRADTLEASTNDLPMAG
jgi:hypothetical protein